MTPLAMRKPTFHVFCSRLYFIIFFLLVNIIFSKIISKANEYEFITNITIKIYKSELDIIQTVEDDYSRNLLVIYLVYYKWAKNIKHLQFYSKKNDITMVVENNNDIWKLAGLSKLRVADRYRLCNLLYSKGLYKIDNFKSHNYIYIPFAVDDGEIAIEIEVCHQAFLKTSTNLAIIFHTWVIFDEKKGDLSHISLITGIGNDRNVKIFRELKKLLYL